VVEQQRRRVGADQIGGIAGRRVSGISTPAVDEVAVELD
jgi:hypothetical protein